MRLWIAGIGLGIYGGIQLAILAWPSPVDQQYGSIIWDALYRLRQLGFPDWVDYPQFEFASNIAFFIPIGFFLALALPLRFWWLAIVACLLFSAAAETAQALFIPARFGSIADVVANTAGAIVGALIALLLRLLVRRRDRVVLRRALAQR